MPAEHLLDDIGYRQLVENSEGIRANDLAEDFYCGSMEMRRLDPQNTLAGRIFPRLETSRTYRIAPLCTPTHRDE